MLGGIVIANYITVTTDSETPIHRGKCHNLFVCEVKPIDQIHYKMPMLPSEETMLITAIIL